VNLQKKMMSMYLMRSVSLRHVLCNFDKKFLAGYRPLNVYRSHDIPVVPVRWTIFRQLATSGWNYTAIAVGLMIQPWLVALPVLLVALLSCSVSKKDAIPKTTLRATLGWHRLEAIAKPFG
jgi:hypothetical protein